MMGVVRSSSTWGFVKRKLKITRPIASASPNLPPIESLERRRLFAGKFGALDQTFGTLGHAESPIYDSGLTVGNDGYIYAIGSAGIAKFSASGVLDTSYGNAGIASLPTGGLGYGVNSAGQLYELVQNSSGVSVVRYTSTGQLDESFGNGGSVALATQLGDLGKTWRIGFTVQPDGKLILAYVPDYTTLFVQRFNADGSPDLSFASRGEFSDANFQNAPISTASVGTEYWASVVGCCICGNGDILVGGGSYVDLTADADHTTAQLFIARLTPAGGLDSAYAGGGISDLRITTTVSVTNPSNLFPAIFTSDSAGYAALTVNQSYAAPAQLGLFAPTGRATLVAKSTSRLGAAVAADGETCVLAGSVLSTLSAAGTLENQVTLSSFQPVNIVAVGATQSVAVAPDGDVLAVGAPASGAGSEISAFSLGITSVTSPEQIPNGTSGALASVPGGTLDLAYHNSLANGLEFTASPSAGLWDNPVTVDSSLGAGNGLSIAISPASVPVVDIAYINDAHQVKLATSTNAGDTFSTQLIDPGAKVTDAPAIYVNHEGLASVAFFDQSTHHLLLAKQNRSGKWKISTIDSSSDDQSDIVLVPSPSGQLAVAYSDNTHGWLKWAEQTGTGVWEIHRAARVSGGAQGISMAWGTAASAAIAFYDTAHHKLRLTQVTDGTMPAFTTTTIAPDVGQTTAVTLAANAGATPRIYASDSAADNIQEFVAVPSSSSNQYLSYPVVAASGVDFSIVGDGGTEVASYIDPGTGDLAVAPIP
jgi:uncharacterized delta-60 repeat protein